MDHHSYSAGDFIANEQFQDWVLRPTLESDAYWQNWFAEHPQHWTAADEARQFIRSVRFRHFEPEPGTQSAVWAAIQASEARTIRLSGWRTVARYAAVLLLMAMGGWYYTRYVQPVTVQTAFGQRQTVHLPDGSLVQLNANSSLRYRRSWSAGRDREVWLTGEGFFQVTKQRQTGELVKFTVHTDQLDVEVLGTQFNVNTRRRETQVVLAEGKVRLRGEEANPVVMQPGELARLREGEAQINTRTVDPGQYASWRVNRVVFNQVPLWEVARSLEDYFGYRVTFADAALANRVFKGTLPADNATVWLATLEKSFPLRIDARQKHVVFGTPRSF
ncbi:MAG: FecR domain-containing protein [Cytophagales bacterium]|nr:FecR domain-containing protein [Cytophagales bacterium]